MKKYTELHYYVITQVINGQKNYYSHWERLEQRSSVYGIVWQEHLVYAYIYTNHSNVKKMLARIKEYDNRLNCLIEQVTKEEIEQALLSIPKEWPSPDFSILPDGRIIEVKDRVTGELINNLKKVS